MLTIHYLPSQAKDAKGTHNGRPCVVPGMTFSYHFGVTYCVRYTDGKQPAFEWVTPSKGHERPVLEISDGAPASR